MKNLPFLIVLLLDITFFIQSCKPASEGSFSPTEINEIGSAFFMKDPYWRGADGAATVDLEKGKVLWLFSDTFIDQDGTGSRANSRSMIRNSIGIQSGKYPFASVEYFYSGKPDQPEDFFALPGENWFWTGHGIMVKDKLAVFLMEITATGEGLGFEAIAWHVALIDNPGEDPSAWKIRYLKGSDTFGVILGSSAALKTDDEVFIFGVKEPATHETYLLKMKDKDLIRGNFSELSWWVGDHWKKDLTEEPVAASLFTSQTEFSVHFDKTIHKYIQFQSFGFGQAEIGYRMADKLQGPWSESVMIYRPEFKDEEEFMYSVNAHPELSEDKLIITYNINNFDFGKLVRDENIYFPKLIELSFTQ